MKVLMSIMPATGHINLAQPIAAELIRRGHTVHFLTGPTYQSSVEATGATFISFNSACMAAISDPLSPEAQTKHGTGLAAAVSILTELFVSPIPPIVAQYKSIYQTFKADIILADFVNLPAYVWRELGGPVNVTLSLNPLFTMDPEIPPWGSSAWPPTTTLGSWMNIFLHWVADWFVMSKINAKFNEERAKLGLLSPVSGEEGYPRNLLSTHLHLLPTTPAFEFPRERLGQQVRFVGPLLPVVARDWERPVWWEEVAAAKAEDGKRVVHVTQGTFVIASVNLIKPTIRALASEDYILLVVTTIDADTIAAEMDIPDNVRLAPFTPHQELLKHVDVMVTNGGYGGVLTALSMGVPLVGAGLTEDKAMVNARIAWSGVGIDLKTNTPTEEMIRRAVRKVLDDERYGRKAKEIQADFDKYPGPKNACNALEEFVRDL